MNKTVRFCTVLAVNIREETVGSLCENVSVLLNSVCLVFAGEELRQAGSVFLFFFDRADDAIRAACEAQKEALEQEELTGTALPFSIGLQSGQILREDGDWRGDPITLAMRLAKIASPRKILAASGLRPYLSKKLQRKLKPCDIPVASAGRVGIKISEVVTGSSGGGAKNAPAESAGTPTISIPHQALAHPTGKLDTDTASRKLPLPGGLERPAPVLTPKKKKSPLRLCLIQGRHLIVVDEQTRRVSIGRDECDVIVNTETASRHHADVRYVGGEFVVEDHSWNGTYVYSQEGGEGKLIHNARYTLPKDGYICPGTPEVSELFSIRFRRSGDAAPGSE